MGNKSRAHTHIFQSIECEEEEEEELSLALSGAAALQASQEAVATSKV